MPESHEQNQYHQSTSPEPAAPSAPAHQPTMGRPSHKTKAHLTVASLNISGRGLIGAAPGNTNKWNAVYHTLKDRRIGILAVQETHFTPQTVETIRALYGRRLVVEHSSCPTTSNAAGVAFVLNKSFTDTTRYTTEEVIPGRAMLLRTEWHNEASLHILNVYAPNAPADNRAFWAAITELWSRKRWRKPDLVMGDFNIVEGEIDRMRRNHGVDGEDRGAMEALADLTKSFKLLDGWRAANPHKRAFSFPVRDNASSLSRLDRIYVSETLEPHVFDWEIFTSPVPTDHKMVLANVTHPTVPFIGKGRWTMPVYLLRDKELMCSIQMLAKSALIKMDGCREGRNDSQNPQTVFNDFKSAVRDAARRRARVAIPRIDTRIRALQVHLDLVLNDANIRDSEPLRLEAALLQQRIAELTTEKLALKKDATASNFRLQAETQSKYWAHLAKEPKPRDILVGLLKPVVAGAQGDPLERRSDKMAELARDYHESIQSEDRDRDLQSRAMVMDGVLDHVKVAMNDEQREGLAALTSYVETAEALHSAANGKATGLDGIPYEMWKMLALKHKEHKGPEADRPADILQMLTVLFNDIEQHGLVEGSTFAEGWMCPLYKGKGLDRRDVKSYRPITLLNSDYKLFTKTIAMRLARVAPSLIHPDQAGFVPGRSITDQIRQTQLMISYAEANDDNGLIVALDQEKAYDKIMHDYLWKVLEKYGAPAALTSTIKSLYAQATTRVMINGEASSTFLVTRGVRQGDPMSCLLFDLAIEPLADMLRQSDLQGYRIPGIREKVITSLFADDTTVYLSEFDDYYDLVEILDTWCLASGAKFNINKTKILPIGSPAFRSAFVENRRTQSEFEWIPDIPESPDIIPDGSAIRMLGAFVGNKVDQGPIWAGVISRISAALDRWRPCCPTFVGKQIIVTQVVGGMTQYLTKAQGMPSTVAKSLQGLVDAFVWEGKRATVSRAVLSLPLTDGGVGMLDLLSRNEAIELMWLKSYLDLGSSRAKWAFIADDILAQNISTASGKVAEKARVNTFLQNWGIKTARTSSLPAHLARMMSAAKKHNVNLAAVKLSSTLKKEMPIWYHKGTQNRLKFLNNAKSSGCLREVHGVVTVRHAQGVARRLRTAGLLGGHVDHTRCACPACVDDRDVLGCNNPALCARTARRLLDALDPTWDPAVKPPSDGLTHTKRRRRRNRRAAREGGALTFNPTVTAKDGLAQLFRVFSDPVAPQARPGHRPPPGLDLAQDKVTVYTDGACVRNGCLDSRAGSGVWFGPGDARNISFRIPGDRLTNQIGEVVAVYLAARAVENFAPLHIVSDSRYVIDGLTKHLPRWEQKGWVGVANADYFRAVAGLLRKRSATTTFQWVKGHDSSVGNIEADRLAGRGAQKPVPDVLELVEEAHLLPSGAQLSTLTQATAYKAIRLRKRPQLKAGAIRHLDMARHAVAAAAGGAPTDAALWKATRDRAFTRPVSMFVWKGLQDSHRCGRIWEKSPQYAHLADCPICRVPESLEHIMTDCDVVATKVVWSLAKELFLRKHVQWPEISLGTILGCGLLTVQGKDGKPLKGTSRLLRILISESAFLLWKLRCERRVRYDDDESKRHTKEEVAARWYSAVNLRLDHDRGCAKLTLVKKAISSALVLKTWSGVLQDEALLPEDWTRIRRRVLVGSGRRELRHGVG